jgi:hypothetical protein
MKQLTIIQILLGVIATLAVSHGLISEADRDSFTAALSDLVAAGAALGAIIVRNRQQRIRQSVALKLPPEADEQMLEQAIHTGFAEFGFLSGLRKALTSEPARIASEILEIAVPQAAPIARAVQDVAQQAPEQTTQTAPNYNRAFVELQQTQARLRAIIRNLDLRVTRLEQLFQASPQPQQPPPPTGGATDETRRSS